MITVTTINKTEWKTITIPKDATDEQLKELGFVEGEATTGNAYRNMATMSYSRGKVHSSTGWSYGRNVN